MADLADLGKLSGSRIRELLSDRPVTCWPLLPAQRLIERDTEFWFAPVGTPFPAVDEEPPAPWKRLG